MMTEAILAIICQLYDVTRAEIAIKDDRRQQQRIVEAKQTAAYCLWRYTRYTGDQIANILGYYSGNNIVKARKAVKEIASANRSYREQLADIEKQILRD